MVAFQILSSSRIRLRVLDNLGREVAVLVDAEREAGRYQIPFDGSRLPGGTYFLRLEAGGKVLFGKMTVEK
jgi:hypothetical protein